MVYCYSGDVFQVVVDVRKNSETFGEVFACEIGEKNPKAVWVPPGCANGFCVVSKSDAVYGYAVTAEFEAGKETGLLWNDPKIVTKINWPIQNPILSDKDKINPLLESL
ncbi:dTDP-4-dehydrorhamnose 3,5-epimerase family protein [Candidatus Gottesmanbacteria bacterium]|nr:dTDP-4-dehydrorhamnose 3,5-epimerase family protein [Candidatus Gottesmanbacteria bacterium]